jgi:serine/threonine-protein kinase
MVTQYLNGVQINLRSPFDLDFINNYGKVFKVFDRQSSGNLCFGVEKAGKRYFLKFAGADTLDYSDTLIIEDAVARLRFTVPKYKDLYHPLLINQIGADEIGGGFITVFDWFDGESCGYPQKEACERFMALPNKEKLRVYEGILEFHSHVAERGYVAIDFNDQATLYNFVNGNFAICDIDFYTKQCYMCHMGAVWGDPSLKSPEEDRIGGVVDEISNVYAMGATAFVFFAKDDKNSREKWSLDAGLYEVAKKSVSEQRTQRQQSIRNYINEWNNAK